MQNNQKEKTRFLVQLSLLVALQLILVMTPLGLIPIGPVYATIVHIPVLIGAIVLGWKAGISLGLIFGIISMVYSTLRGTSDAVIFSPFVSVNPVGSIIVAIVPRVLFALLAALLFKLLATKMNDIPAAGIAAGVASLVHTVLVLSGVYIFFANVYAGIIDKPREAVIGTLAAVVGTNGLIEAVIAVVVCAAVVKPLRIVTKR